ncbi:hypothetical protein ACFL27_04645 [candidate division CSSED10-310 bacterium]|uniref:Intracellular proteinase inhibitor BsuPI domain-containing protein n=1 Tax=candidate division CSSED10-310 bacterium TaxID=2855610 RepID=A0ABV6YTS1_UNCC1
MTKLFLIAVLIISLTSYLSCAPMNKLSVPAAVLALNPELDCPDMGQPETYKLKAELHQIEDITYLIILLDPGHVVRENPWVKLKGGFAIYEGNRDHFHYFKLGKLVKSEEIGRFGFKTSFRVRTRDGDIVYDERIFRLVRKEGSSCLLMYLVPNSGLPAQFE